MLYPTNGIAAWRNRGRCASATMPEPSKISRLSFICDLRSGLADGHILYARAGEFQHHVEHGGWPGLVTLEDVIAGNGVAEYASEEDVRREVGSQADAGKANGSR